MSEQTQPMKAIGEIDLIKVRLAFPDLWVPTSMKPDQPKQYGSTFLMEKGSENQKRVEAAIKRVAKAKWPQDWEEVLELVEGDTQLCCFIDGDHKKKKKLDGFSGNWSLSAKNKKRPTIVDRDGVTPLTEADGRPYAGCYVNAKVEIWAQDNSNGRAIRASLLGVVYHSKGDAFGGGRVASTDELANLAVSDDEDEEALLGGK